MDRKTAEMKECIRQDPLKIKGEGKSGNGPGPAKVSNKADP